MQYKDRERSGNVAVMVAVGLTTLLAIGAVTIDISYARVVQQQLQNASEAGASAGCLRLDGTDEGMASARVTAAFVAGQNYAAGDPVSVAPADILLGVWDEDAEAFVESDDPAVVNTVEVRARVTSLSLFLAPVGLGRDTLPVSAQARSVAEATGAGAVNCFIPLAMPDCLVEQHGLEGVEDLTLQVNTPGVDSVGWARPNGNPSADWARDQIGDCHESGEVEVGDPIGLQNGVIPNALAAIADEVSTSTTRWDTTRWGALPDRMTGSAISASNYGKTYEGPIMVFDGGDEYCVGSGGAFNGTQPLKGFMWAAIYDVKNSGSASSRTVKLRLDTSSGYTFGTSAGGPDYGVTYSVPRFVRND